MNNYPIHASKLSDNLNLQAHQDAAQVRILSFKNGEAANFVTKPRFDTESNGEFLSFPKEFNTYRRTQKSLVTKFTTCVALAVVFYFAMNSIVHQICNPLNAGAIATRLHPWEQGIAGCFAVLGGVSLLNMMMNYNSRTALFHTHKSFLYLFFPWPTNLLARSVDNLFAQGDLPLLRGTEYQHPITKKQVEQFQNSTMSIQGKPSLMKEQMTRVFQKILQEYYITYLNELNNLNTQTPANLKKQKQPITLHICQNDQLRKNYFQVLAQHPPLRAAKSFNQLVEKCTTEFYNQYSQLLTSDQYCYDFFLYWNKTCVNQEFENALESWLKHMIADRSSKLYHSQQTSQRKTDVLQWVETNKQDLNAQWHFQNQHWITKEDLTTAMNQYYREMKLPNTAQQELTNNSNYWKEWLIKQHPLFWKDYETQNKKVDPLKPERDKDSEAQEPFSLQLNIEAPEQPKEVPVEIDQLKQAWLLKQMKITMQSQAA